MDDIRNLDAYLNDIAATAREAVTTADVRVKAYCLFILAQQTGRLGASFTQMRKQPNHERLPALSRRMSA